jgi:hypothetical protein
VHNVDSTCCFGSSPGAVRLRVLGKATVFYRNNQYRDVPCFPPKYHVRVEVLC